MSKRRFRTGVAILIATLSLGLLAGCTSPGKPANPELILATTTSTQDSGLLDILVPRFEQQTGYHVKVIAVGSGAALAMGERGEADVILAHAPAGEQKLVDAGLVSNRRQVMYNDFLLVGPASDPAKIQGMRSATDALTRIVRAGAPFVSRGDDSGTHRLELDLWKRSGIRPSGPWYIQSGTGMANTLAIARDKDGYTITDRATHLAQKDRLMIHVEGDPVLLNIYHVMQVNPEKFAKVNRTGGAAFVKFMVDPGTQQIIKAFGTDKYGQPLFFPNAKD